jgi:simple sugar transport system permease protein
LSVAANSAPAEGQRFQLKKFLRNKDISIALLTGALLLICALINPLFISQANIFTMLKTIPEVGIIALGMTMLIICGEFDLSVGSNFAFSSFVMAYLNTRLGVPLWLAFAACILVGVGIGWFNGFITTRIGISSFVTTLATMMIWRGAVLLASAGFPEPLSRDQPFVKLFTGSVAGIPAQFLWFIGLAIIMWIVLENHRFGNWTYVTGGNKPASVAMGIPVNAVKTINFMLVGGLAALAGAIQVFRMGSGYSNAGTGLEMQVIASVVIGGTLLTGGSGTMVGTVMGVIIIFAVENILILSRAPAFWFRLFLGVILLLAVIVHLLIQGKKQ